VRTIPFPPGLALIIAESGGNGSWPRVFTIVAAKKRAVEKKGDVKLLMPNETVYKVLSMLSLHLIFEIHQDEAKALGSFAA